MNYDVLLAVSGALAGFLVGMGNAYLRKVAAKRLLKTEKKMAVTLVSLFSLARLAIIALIVYSLFFLIKSKIFAIGAVGGLVINSFLTTFYYIIKKKSLKEQEKV